MAALFPMFVKLGGRRCVIVGGGNVAQGKIAALLLSEADVLVIAPRVSAKIEGLVKAGRVQWKCKEFAPSDLTGAALVIAATNSLEVNGTVFRVAERLGILCNAVDQPEECHFYYPAVVRRGALQIAISTSGLSPSLAHRLRVELEEQFGPEYEEYLEWLSALRRAVLKKHPDMARRRRILERVAGRAMFETRLRSRSRR